VFSMALSQPPVFILTNRLFHSDKCALSGRLLAPLDALHLRVLFALVVV
jgi:hypothetical protein